MYRIQQIIQYILLIIQREDGEKNHIECIFDDTLLTNKDLFSEDEPIFNILDYYYSLYFDVYSLLKINIWQKIDELQEYNDKFSILSDEEISKLSWLKENIESNRFIIDKNSAYEIKDVIENDVAIEDIEGKIKVLYDIKYLITELEQFKSFDDTIDKNTYKENTKESIFHQHIYPYLCKVMGKDNGVILSEVSTGRERYDLYYYDIKKDISVIIELKVNDLSSINNNIKQLEGYLDKVNYKDSIFVKEPNFGVLLVYDVGSKKLKDIYEKVREEIACTINDNVLLCTNTSKPIVVFVMGESKIKK